MRDRRTIVQLSRPELTALREFATRHLVDYAPRTAGAHRALAALLGAAERGLDGLGRPEPPVMLTLRAPDARDLADTLRERPLELEPDTREGETRERALDRVLAGLETLLAAWG